MSLSLRDDIYSNINETPGPGYYDTRTQQPFINVKGGTSLANRSERFVKPKETAPGPGQYNTTIDNKENKQHHDLTETKISKQRVKFNRKKNAPSIQDPKNAYGFEELNGELVAQKAPDRDPTLGPAYYSTDNINNIYKGNQASKYKGVHFSKYSSKRTDFSSKPGPGPGDYDITEPSIRLDVEHYHSSKKGPIDTNRITELNIPRYPEMILKNVEKEAIPGPGQYNQTRLFDNKIKSLNNINSGANAAAAEIERPPFGVQTKRFSSAKHIKPGPGSYNDQRTALSTLTRIHGLKRTPFSQSSVRFVNNDNGNNTMKIYSTTKSAPGPGQYKITGFAEESLRKSIIDVNRKPAFGQSSIRTFDLTKKDNSGNSDDLVGPGPGHYNIKDKPFNKIKKERYSAMFASTTEQRESRIDDGPGPTDYNVPKAYDHLIHARREAPRTKEAMRRQESFNITSNRTFNLASSDEIPGPGAYDTINHKPKVKQPRLTEKRWRDMSKDDSMPGPADYILAASYQDTLLKGTFNATLNNPLVYKDKHNHQHHRNNKSIPEEIQDDNQMTIQKNKLT
jgi:hypothetical protein